MTDLTRQLNGDDFAAEAASNGNYAPAEPAGGYTLVAVAGQPLTWAGYVVPGLAEFWPVSLSVEVEAAEPQAGGNPLTLQYFIGVSDYTNYSWDWRGPFNGNAEVVLNQKEDEETEAYVNRCVDATGNLQFVIATGYAVSGTEEVPAVTVVTAEVLGSTAAEPTRPHFPLLSGTRTGSSLDRDVREVSALKPEQFAHIDWNHIAAISQIDQINEAEAYTFQRRRYDEPQFVQVGSVGSFKETFNDPLDLDNGIPEPQAGALHEYMVTARNAAGTSASSRISLTIPMLAPEMAQATTDNPDIEGIELSWNGADGAVSYEVWRSESVNPLSSALLAAGVSNLTIVDQSAVPGQYYWYFIKAVGTGDGNAANGLEPGQVSDLSQGAQGLASYEISIDCITPGVSGSGTEADPFILLAGQEYDFTATTQNELALTFASDWTVEPDNVAQFDEASHLTGIEPSAGLFSIEAVYNWQEYSWSGFAWCLVEDS